LLAGSRSERIVILSAKSEQAKRKPFKSLGWYGKAAFGFVRPAIGWCLCTLAASFELEVRPEFLEGKAFTSPRGAADALRPG
jgi:hypothetical protein